MQGSSIGIMQNPSVNGSNRRHAALRKFDTQPNILRGLLTMGFSLFAIILFLATSLYTTGDNQIDILADVNIFGVISAMFNQGKFIFEAADIGELSVTMPAGASILITLCFVCLLVSFVCGVLGALGKWKGYDKPVLMAVNAFTTLVLLITFLVSILPGMKATDIWGTEKEFYSVFSPSAGIFFAILFSVLGFATAWGVSVNNAKLVRKNWLMYVFLLVPAVLVVVYSIYPMIL